MALQQSVPHAKVATAHSNRQLIEFANNGRRNKWLGDLHKGERFYEDEQIDEDELAEYFIRWDSSITKLNETLSDKNMVMPSNAHYLIFAHSFTTLNHVYSHYIKHVKEFAYITGKQAGKIVKGKVSKLQLLFDPKDRNESLEAGFYGQACDECGSWRTEFRATNDTNRLFLYCFACKKFSKHKTELLKQ